ncbi:MAG: transcription termination/antitermination protein NusG [Akkermansiaceae bacterium]|jgi:transcriptional antiterminator RfaH
MEEQAEWYVVRTQTKRERLAAEHLRELAGVEVFCPMLRYRKATRRGKVWWEEALFPSYVLARFRLTEMQRAVGYCQGVRGFVKFGNTIPSVSTRVVEDMRRTWQDEAVNDTLTIKPRFERGDEVELAHGPLQGLKGSIIEVLPGIERVKVLLDFLGQPQMVDVDLFSLLLPRRPLPQE